MTWETVIGLEVHVQLGTRTKMFCGCAPTLRRPAQHQRRALPASACRARCRCPMWRRCACGARAALALGCTVHPVSMFARKNYFYPDLPKGYQISQFDRAAGDRGSGRDRVPGARRGSASVITRLHLEEDAGKSLHDRFPGRTAVDLNRAGVAARGDRERTGPAVACGGPRLPRGAASRSWCTPA